MNKIFDSPEKKIDELLKQKTKTQYVDMEIIKDIEPSDKKSDKNIDVPKGEGLKKIYDNLKFVDTVNKNPVMLKKSYRGYTHRVMDLNHFLNLRLYPRSIYTTDKLLRIVAVSKYEQLKKYLAKKRKVSLNFLYIILIIMGVVVAVIVILLLLPKFIGGI